MIRVEQHIANLLRRHDCVQVPYFGGFVLNSAGAAFAHAHELLPPGKSLSFNRNLHMNDGLLFSHISTAEKIPYYQAISAVQQAVQQWKNSLTQNHILQLAEIGTFRQEDDGRWQFEPHMKTFADANSYGLSTLHLTPIEELLHKPHVRARDKYVADKSVSAETTRKKVRGIWLKRAAAATSIAALLVIAFLFATKHFSLPSYMQNQQARVETPVINEQPQIISSEKETTTENLQPKTEAPQQANILDKVIEETSAVAEKVFTPQTSFHVIGGSFSSEKNARKFEKELEKKGYSAEVLHNENGFYRVSYFAEADSLVADKLLQKIKTDENQGAWLLKW